MKKTIIIAAFWLISTTTFSQATLTAKVILVNDSIKEMGRTNGRMQVLIAAPQAGTSIIVQSIDVRNQVINRLYSPTQSECNYVIGYQKGAYWYDVSVLPFDQLNSTGNTTFFYNSPITSRLWQETQTDSAPLMIKFDKCMDFTTGFNRMTLFITYRILN